MQSTSLKSPTKAERERFRRIAEIGCVACHQLGRYRVAEAHHLLSGHRRIGHSSVVALCEWHHRAIPPSGMSQQAATAVLGPSLALLPRLFRQTFGADSELLIETNRRIAAARGR